MTRYKLINNITGWAVFAVAAAVYLLTRTDRQFWDCGEFIASTSWRWVIHPGLPSHVGGKLFRNWQRIIQVAKSIACRINECLHYPVPLDHHPPYA